MKTLLMVILILKTGSVFAHGVTEGSANVGKDKAITEFDDHKGFKLSEKTVQNFGIKFLPIGQSTKEEVFIVSSESIAHFQDKAAVYVQKDGWVRRVEGKVLNKNQNQTTFQSEKLSSGEMIAISGVPVLRVTDIELTAGESEEDESEHNDNEKHEE